MPDFRWSLVLGEAFLCADVAIFDARLTLGSPPRDDRRSVVFDVYGDAGVMRGLEP